MRTLDPSRAGPWFAALLALAFVAFWPSYFAPGPAASSATTHLHAAAATLWMLLLVVQPWAIRSRRLELHRSLGRASYALAIAWRRRAALHWRLMACTGLTLVDPVVVRLMLWVQPVPAWNYQWLTFGLTDAVLLLLIWRERQAASGRAVFPAMLALFLAAQLPALPGVAATEPWMAFAGWLAAR